MKKYSLIAIVCAASAILTAGSVLGQDFNGVNEIGYTNTFEGLIDGSQLTNQFGWYIGSTDDVAIVTNNGDYGYVGYPVPDATHENAIYFETVTASGGVSNLLNGAAINDPIAVANMYIDIMLKPGRMDPEGNRLIQNVASNAAQMAAYVDTNGVLTLWHAIDTSGLGNLSNQWTTLYTDDFIKPIGSSEWVRVTVAFDFISDGTFYQHYFQIRLNNNQPYTNAEAFTSPDLSTPKNGTWFLCSKDSQSRTYISALTLGGMGMADDVVVGTGSPGAPTYKVVPSVNDSVHGAISPSTMSSATIGDTTTIVFTITATDYWHVANVQTNGLDVFVVDMDNTMMSYAYTGTFTEATTVKGIVKPSMAANGTPWWWLAQHSLTNGTGDNSDFNAAEAADPDGDLMISGDEFVGGTDPNNRNSVFTIFKQGQSGGSNYVEWLGGTSSGGASSPYLIWISTNLLGSPKFAPTGTIGRVEGTNVWWDTLPPVGVPAFYKVNATN